MDEAPKDWPEVEEGRLCPICGNVDRCRYSLDLSVVACVNDGSGRRCGEWFVHIMPMNRLTGLASFPRSRKRHGG